MRAKLTLKDIAIALLLTIALLGSVKSDQGAVIPLNDENFDYMIDTKEVALVNFFAAWCRFCQMLEPIWIQAAQAIDTNTPAILATVDCMAENTVKLRERFGIGKFPTIKVFRKGHVLKSEYRGQRSEAAIVGYVQELVKNPLIDVSNDGDIDAQIQKHRKGIIGHFTAATTPADIDTYAKISSKMRDECHFMVNRGSDMAGPSGSSIIFKSRTEQLAYEGDVSNEAALEEWIREHCIPLVREITFENGEELTEEGLPFCILFYNPEDLAPVKKFTQLVREQLSGERGKINFITADGFKFAHPIKHLGKSKADLPILAMDTFKHMFMFGKFSDIDKPGKLIKFIEDLHSGKLHLDFHNPPPQVPEIEAVVDNTGAVNPDVVVVTGDAPAADPAVVQPAENTPPAEGVPTLAPAEKPAEPEKPATLKDRLEAAQAQKNPGEPVFPTGAPLDGDDDDASKPISVKSVLKHLKPGKGRYSFRDKDEL